MASTYESRAAKQLFLGLPLDTYIFSCLSSSIQNTKDKTKLHKRIMSAGYTEADEYGKWSIIEAASKSNILLWAVNGQASMLLFNLSQCQRVTKREGQMRWCTQHRTNGVKKQNTIGLKSCYFNFNKILMRVCEHTLGSNEEGNCIL